MAITDKEQGVWELEQVYNKINEGGIWQYSSDQKQLMGWGRNITGSLGFNDIISRSSPTQIPGTGWAKYISGGSKINGAIKTDGTLWTWGKNDVGQLGVNDTVQRSSPTQVGSDTTWNYGITKQSSSMGVKTDNTLWAWGDNEDGNLGLNAPEASAKSSPTQIPGTSWTKVYASSRSVIAQQTLEE